MTVRKGQRWSFIQLRAPFVRSSPSGLTYIVTYSPLGKHPRRIQQSLFSRSKTWPDVTEQYFVIDPWPQKRGHFSFVGNTSRVIACRLGQIQKGQLRKVRSNRREITGDLEKFQRQPQLIYRICPSSNFNMKASARHGCAE